MMQIAVYVSDSAVRGRLMPSPSSPSRRLRQLPVHVKCRRRRRCSKPRPRTRHAADRAPPKHGVWIFKLVAESGRTAVEPRSSWNRRPGRPQTVRAYHERYRKHIEVSK